MSWLEFQVELAIRLSLQVYHDDASYAHWALRWLDGSDRSISAALVAAIAVSMPTDYASVAAKMAIDAAMDCAADDYDAAVSNVTSSIIHGLKAGAKLEDVVQFI